MDALENPPERSGDANNGDNGDNGDKPYRVKKFIMLETLTKLTGIINETFPGAGYANKRQPLLQQLKKFGDGL